MNAILSMLMKSLLVTYVEHDEADRLRGWEFRGNAIRQENRTRTAKRNARYTGRAAAVLHLHYSVRKTRQR